VRGLIRSGTAPACHDISDGGLAVTLAEMCMAAGRGATVATGSGPRHAVLFGEDQARYVVGVSAGAADGVETAAAAAGIALRRLGVVGGDRLVLDGASVAVADLTIAHESWFPNYMSGTLAEAAE
jgi:phosphoribosylformylglycinamidine synthase